MDRSTITDWLARAARPEVARRRARQLRPLRGLRGVADADLARIAARAWRAGVSLPEDDEALHALFLQAFEDGLVATALLAAALPDDPARALARAEAWIGLLDDLVTADALGWLALGPALRAVHGELAGPLAERYHRDAPTPWRRALVLAGMAALPEPILGPAAAALRERRGRRTLALAETVDPEVPRALLAVALRDPDPHVRRGLVRLVRTWAGHDPDGAEAALAEVRGGVPRRLAEEAGRAARRARRRRG